MKFTKTQLALMVALLAGNAIILFSPASWSWLRLPAAAIFVMLLPGLAWLPALGWMLTRRGIERAALAVGMSSLISALVLLAAILWPGPFRLAQVLVALNVAVLAGIAAQSFPKIQLQPRAGNNDGRLAWPPVAVLLILLAIVVLAGVTRFTRLGYAEFHEDELENTRLITRVYHGEEFAIFQDSKGPIHALYPATLWFANGWMNEGILRFPFALISMAQILLAFELARRMTGESNSVGLLTAGFVALNGYFVSLSRHLENRIFIVFWGVLLMWLTYRYYREDVKHFLLYAALALGIGLIAHFEMLFFVAVVVFLVGWKQWQARSLTRADALWLVAAAAFFAAIAALFYVPYFRDPEIGLVFQYLAEDRIGTSLLYNNVANMFKEDRLYSAPYHLPLLSLLLLWLLARNFWQAGRRWLPGLVVLLAAMFSVALQPDWWVAGGINFAFVPFALLTLAVLALPRTSYEIKNLYLWLSAPIGAILFLTLDASNHVMLGETAWAILAAIALVDIWRALTPGQTEPAPTMPPHRFVFAAPAGVGAALKTSLVLLLVLAAAVTFSYEYLVSNAAVTTYWQARTASQQNPNSVYNWLYGAIARPRRIISNPRFGGWKAVGVLWESGQLGGDFRSMNESFAVPIWYTFQTPRSCYDDPQNIWVRRNDEGWPDEESQLVERGYTLTRVVLVDGRPKLHLYEKGAPPAEPQLLDVEDFRAQFDRLATPDHFAPAENISQPVSLNFGDKLLLRGFDLPPSARPGDLLPVTVYWDALAPMEIRYRAFVHLLAPDGARLAQHDDDPACRLLTPEMRPGQESSRQFRLPIPADAPPGEYTVLLGVYHPDSFERLSIWDNTAQNSPGNSFVLGKVRVQ